jgi:DDE domain
VFVSINGRQLCIWGAVDSEGEVLDILVQPRLDRKAALMLMRKLLKKQGGHSSYHRDRQTRILRLCVARTYTSVARWHDRGHWKNNRAEIPISHCDNTNDEGIAEATASITKVYSGALSDWLGKRKSSPHSVMALPPSPSRSFYVLKTARPLADLSCWRP